jgi:hypothetical protein
MTDHLSPLADAIRALSAEDREALTAKLQAASSAKPMTMTFAQAMTAAAFNPRRLQELEQVKAMAKRLNVEIVDQKVLSLRDLDAQLKQHPIATRLEFKTSLAHCGLLD